MILQRLGEPSSCRCLSSTDTCISLRQVYSEHDMEWRIFFKDVSKGSIMRNSKKKLKDSSREPHMIWDDTVAEPSTIRSLISRCDKGHGDCKPLTQSFTYDRHGKLQSIVPNLYFIDVNQDRIVNGDLRSEYAALSYVWGRVSQPVALRGNISRLMRKGSLLSQKFQLPPLIQDAMALVHSLGMQYLWVDSLCIIQDSASKHDILARMDTIYSLASLTIVAIDSDSAHSRLPGVFPQTRYHLNPGLRTKKDWFHSRPSCDMHAQIQSSTVYNSRAWTFQELLLSTRCLYMTKYQIYFRCRTGVWAETMPFKNLGLQADLYAQLIQKLSGENRLQAYRALVHDYSARKLSYSTDVLDAFSGITSLLGSNTSWQFIEGLVLEELASELLFIHEGEFFKRLTLKGEPWMPSWSWAGWEGRVRWNPSDMEGGGDLRTLWKLLFEGQEYSTGPSTMEQVEVHLSTDALARLQAGGAHQCHRGIIGELKRRDIRLCPRSNEDAGISLLQFKSAYLPAQDIQLELWEDPGFPMTNDLYGDIYRIGVNGSSVGVLFGAQEEHSHLIRLGDTQFWFAQVTTHGALLLKTGSKGYEERAGVAFFWETTFSEKCPFRTVLLQ
ncbi:HET-domain-containing protein [Zopfia rhizophila CBS 207.26]|uniref:HET-domain-containing protein n=1 Tax=Zopfia rhizophila CBS 207.26 TaxID=1314779 RepID=A0A6A6DVA8_9PEZI|nr:HET-domain-containing protein [Zopfia rhizophila CBS 207.26]